MKDVVHMRSTGISVLAVEDVLSSSCRRMLDARIHSRSCLVLNPHHHRWHPKVSIMFIFIDTCRTIEATPKRLSWPEGRETFLDTRNEGKLA
jgi:hypothetical protein